MGRGRKGRSIMNGDIFAFTEGLLAEVVRELFTNSSDLPIILERPLQAEFGDVSSAIALKIASRTRQNPFAVAQAIHREILQKLGQDKNCLKDITVVQPGFINIFFSDQALKRELALCLEQGELFFRALRKFSEKVVLEFVSANPTGPLSVAHGRQAVVGDVIGRLLSFVGFEVTREYYINDMGTQIDAYTESVRQRMREQEGKDCRIPENGYHGEYVKDIAQQLLSEGYHSQSDIGSRALAVMLEFIQKDLKAVGVAFDSWVSQKNLYETNRIQEAIADLKNQGLIYEQEGAFWFRSTSFGDDKDRVVQRSDGNYTYFSADIAYHADKLKRGFSRLINLWGPDHHGYIQRVKAAVAAYCRCTPPLEILIIQLVSLKGNIKMSKRAGTMVLFRDLVNDVGKDAARFFYLTRKNSSQLDFDVEQAKKKNFDNPLYYIQYAHARIQSILAKVNHPVGAAAVSILERPEELKLVKEIVFFKRAIQIAAMTREPYAIAEYLKNLAAAFHSFYEQVRVISEDEKVTEARLALIRGVGLTLRTGLGILDVEAPEKM